MASRGTYTRTTGHRSQRARGGGGVVSLAAIDIGNSQKPQLVDCRDAYAKTLEKMAETDTRVCVVINDSLSSAKMKDFGAKYPARFVNVGIAEQNMVGVGNGLANGGMVPYLC